MKYVLIIFFVLVTFCAWACCKVSGDCSREEEKRDGKHKSP